MSSAYYSGSRLRSVHGSSEYQSPRTTSGPDARVPDAPRRTRRVGTRRGRGVRAPPRSPRRSQESDMPRCARTRSGPRSATDVGAMSHSGASAPPSRPTTSATSQSSAAFATGKPTGSNAASSYRRPGMPVPGAQAARSADRSHQWAEHPSGTRASRTSSPRILAVPEEPNARSNRWRTPSTAEDGTSASFRCSRSSIRAWTPAGSGSPPWASPAAPPTRAAC